MYTSVLLGIALTLNAPDKEAPKPAILGEWVAESFKIGDFDLLKEKKGELRFTFAEGGKLTVVDRDEPEMNTYKIDTSKNPAEIEIIPPKDGKEPPLKGIFKVDGDKLILCVVEDKDERPKKFESTKENGGMLLTFKRVKK